MNCAWCVPAPMPISSASSPGSGRRRAAYFVSDTSRRKWSSSRQCSAESTSGSRCVAAGAGTVATSGSAMARPSYSSVPAQANCSGKHCLTSIERCHPGNGLVPQISMSRISVRPGSAARCTMVAPMSAACRCRPGPAGGPSSATRVDAAGVEHHDADVVAAHLVQQRLGEPAQAELAGGVGAGAGVALLAAHGADHEQVAAPALGHGRQEGPGREEHAGQVGLDRAVPLAPASSLPRGRRRTRRRC